MLAITANIKNGRAHLKMIQIELVKMRPVLIKIIELNNQLDRAEERIGEQ